jgi:hypothetical protein
MMIFLSGVFKVGLRLYLAKNRLEEIRAAASSESYDWMVLL